MNDKDIPASQQSGPLLGVRLSDRLGLAPKREPYSQAVWECFYDMPKDGQKLKMLDVLMFGQACADKAQATERERWQAAMALPHLYGGDSPDPDQPNARDPNCAACRALLELGA